MNRHLARYFPVSLVAAAMLLAMLPVSASTTAPGRQVSDPDSGASPVEVTGSVHCRIVGIEADQTLRVRHQTGEAQIHIGDRVSIRAKTRKQFDGRKKLKFADFTPGQWLKLTYMLEDGAINRIKVLPKAPPGLDVAVWTEGAETATLVSDSQ